MRTVKGLEAFGPEYILGNVYPRDDWRRHYTKEALFDYIVSVLRQYFSSAEARVQGLFTMSNRTLFPLEDDVLAELADHLNCLSLSAGNPIGAKFVARPASAEEVTMTRRLLPHLDGRFICLHFDFLP